MYNENNYTSTGLGWLNLVNEAVEELSKIDPEIKIINIKEKFGRLDISIKTPNNDDISLHKVDNILFYIYKKSSYTCECCGSENAFPEETNYWTKTYCNDCHNLNKQGKIRYGRKYE